MGVVAILDDCFSSGEVLAERIATQLGYRRVEDDMVVEGAAALGFPHRKLRGIFESPLTLFNGFMHERRTLLAAIQAAFAREVQGENVVCRANTAYLLPPGLHNVLRVRVIAPQGVRVQAAQNRLHLSRPEAITYIRKVDKARARWIRRLFAANGADPSLCDIVINLGCTSVEEATDIVIGAILRSEQTTGADPFHEVLADWVLSTLVRTQLALDPATRNLELEVTAARGLISIKGTLFAPYQRGIIERVAEQVPGVNEVNLEEIEIVRSSLLLAPEVPPFRQEDDGRALPGGMAFWPAWLMIAAVLCLTIICASLVNKGASELTRVLFPPTASEVRVFSGIITDTKCGSSHRLTGGESESACVRACVEADRDTKYALDDGRRVYVLSDQRTPAMFAAHRVMVVGVLDESTSKLNIRSIELVL